MDLALVIGHHPEAPGAPLELAGHRVTEYEVWSQFARELALTLVQRDVQTDVVERPNRHPDQALADRVNNTGATVAVELHFNAAAGSATGTEMLYYPGSSAGESLAQHLQAETVKALGLEDRGVRSRGDLLFLKKTVMPAVVAEPFFGSEDTDAFTGLWRLPDLMQAYRTALLQHLA